MADGRAGRACPAAVLRGLRGSVPGARVSCRTVRLYVVINRVRDCNFQLDSPLAVRPAPGLSLGHWRSVALRCGSGT